MYDAHEFIRANNLSNDRQGLDAVRKRVLAALTRGVNGSDVDKRLARLADGDFHSMSDLRDLVFHPREGELVAMGG